jgi:hypothetical protein
MTTDAVRDACRNCGHFDGDAAALEAAFPGLSSLSSAYAAVRSDDGLCRRLDRYVAASSVCAQHQRESRARTPP